MRGSIPPLPNTPSWRGAQFKKSTGTTLPSLVMLDNIVMKLDLLIQGEMTVRV
jgi:hypothetical protein